MRFSIVGSPPWRAHSVAALCVLCRSQSRPSGGTAVPLHSRCRSLSFSAPLRLCLEIQEELVDGFTNQHGHHNLSRCWLWCPSPYTDRTADRPVTGLTARSVWVSGVIDTKNSGERVYKPSWIHRLQAAAPVIPRLMATPRAELMLLSRKLAAWFGLHNVPIPRVPGQFLLLGSVRYLFISMPPHRLQVVMDHAS